MADPRWEFGGDTVVDANKYLIDMMELITRQVRLTYDRPSQVGWIFSRLPLTATNFEV
jgi:lectin, mannose-binding 2